MEDFQILIGITQGTVLGKLHIIYAVFDMHTVTETTILIAMPMIQNYRKKY